MNKTNLKKIATKDVVIAVSEDLRNGDITTNLLGKDKNKPSTAFVRSNEDAIFCGRIWFDSTFKYIQKKYGGTLKITWLKNDGDKIKSGQKICKIHAPLRTLLISERTALNFIQFLSGISSKTKLYSEKMKSKKVKLLDTRKTIPGLRASQKYAVKCGGGFNHRFGLSDGILIKDNHIKASGGIENAVKEIKSISGHMQKIEIEADNINQVIAAIDSGVDVIMLDNMTLSDIRNAIRIINKKVLVEASGSISVDNIRDIAETGVDIISVGWITHSAPSLDVGLDFKD